ncbi:hypothetical protein [uncultured Streptococcus sp.]|uniref:hypothetical protein n=1 Tax=uncultured Streptococcus sp. TaxID=83427 RepID=UPI0028D54568|nr:hypothetical protein [uncultured Streptococcus sp.]
MDDILQALAKMLNMTVDEVSSLLTTFKGNAPQIYEMIVKEKMFYDVFRLFQIISIAILVVSSVALAFSIITYFIYDGGIVFNEYRGKTEEEIKLERIERKRKELKLPIKVSCISSSASLITLVVSIVLKVTLAPNYIFIVNEILPRLTRR